MSKKIENIIRKAELKEKKKEEEFPEDFKIYSLITPPILNRSQNRFLKMIFGKNLDKIEQTVLYSKMGIIKRRPCPPNYENMTEEEKKKAEMFCEPRIKKSHEFLFGTPKESCDLEKSTYYITPSGEGICIEGKPTYGFIQCPPENAPENTKLHILNDGTGICLPKDFDEDVSNYLGKTYTGPMIDTKKLTDFINIYKTYDPMKETILTLNEIFKKKNLSILKTSDVKKRVPFIDAFKTAIKDDKDVELANLALLMYANDMKDMDISGEYVFNWTNFDPKRIRKIFGFGKGKNFKDMTSVYDIEKYIGMI